MKTEENEIFADKRSGFKKLIMISYFGWVYVVLLTLFTVSGSLAVGYLINILAKDWIVYIGGTNQELIHILVHALRLGGFDATICEIPGLRGIRPENICNRCKTGKGVQLELSRGLRETLFDNLGDRSLRRKTIVFYQFVNILKEALLLFLGKK